MQVYKIITGRTKEELEEAINYALTDGYRPIGGVTFQITHSSTSMVAHERRCKRVENMLFAQAVLYKDWLDWFYRE
jgi:hypothetical protein